MVCRWACREVPRERSCEDAWFLAGLLRGHRCPARWITRNLERNFRMYHEAWREVPREAQCGVSREVPNEVPCGVAWLPVGHLYGRCLF